MNTPQNLPVAVPFWSADGTGATQWVKAAKKQTFRQSYCNLDPREISIQCRYDRFLPMVLKSEELPIGVLLVEKDAKDYDTVNPKGYADITDLITFSQFTYNSEDYIEFAGSSDINQATAITANSAAIPGGFSTTWAGWVVPDGLYYIILVFADTTKFYSELLQISDFPEFSEVPDGCDSRIRIECNNICEIAGIPPVVSAPQKMFLDFPNSKPQYLYDEEPNKDGQGEGEALWLKLKKRWKITFFAIESVCDFCALLPFYAMLPTGVNITDMYGVQSPVSGVEVDPVWPEDGGDCVAEVTITYSREYFSSTSCC